LGWRPGWKKIIALIFMSLQTYFSMPEEGPSITAAAIMRPRPSPPACAIWRNHEQFGTPNGPGRNEEAAIPIKFYNK
jgi:hypothetical protein